MNLNFMPKHTRSERINKLGQAIRAYRGEYDPELNPKAPAVITTWKVPPDPSAKARVEKWLVSLQRDPVADMKAIDGFKNLDDYRKFMKEIV